MAGPEPLARRRAL